MKNIFYPFYTEFYQKTGGYIPTKPLNTAVYPGDFFQIKNGELILLGNIFRSGIIASEDVELSSGDKLNSANWNFSRGASKTYSGKDHGHDVTGEFDHSRQVITFNDFGSFYFRSNNPEAVRILNWNEINQALIIKMTQTHYSFRELYIVTEVATTSDWTLAISEDKGELEIATEDENFGLVDIFGHSSANTIQSKNIDYYHRESKRIPSFFKAKKLIIQDEKIEVFISDLIQSQASTYEWVSSFYDYNFEHEPAPQSPPQITQGSFLDMLQANQLNPNTALNYFKWSDVSMNDIEKLMS